MDGKKLEAYRKQAGLTQQALGEALGYTGTAAQVTVARWERNDRPVPLKHYRKLGQLLHMPLGELIP